MAAEVTKVNVGSLPTNGNGLNQVREKNFMNHAVKEGDQSTSSEDDEPPPPPPKDSPNPKNERNGEGESYFNPLGLSRTNSIYSLSRVSFSNLLSQLVSLKLPEASSLSSSISSIPTAPTAAEALSGAAEQIQKWIQKASEVLAGLDAEDDVEWAAAGGREGVGEVDSAIGRFEGLIRVYVAAIEKLQERQDISDVPADKLKAVVDQMETTLRDWDNVRKLLKGVKEQVELAMEWEELWAVVLGDIGLEMESLCRLVFEMEEKRHKTLAADAGSDGGVGLDIQELETIVEETPMGGRSIGNHRFSLPPAFPASSPLQSPGMSHAQDDSRLLALFARMQPLRASLDFLPMTLSSFHSRAELILPTACEELESRRKGLEKQWKKLESDAESLRRELGEDRWVLVFRNAGRQAQKMCESVERSLSKLQEAIDAGAQHSNRPVLTKKMESYEAKKLHYGSAIQRVVAIIKKGVEDRLTVNGEVLRLHSDMQARWTTLEAEMKDMDLALEDLNMNKNQQLRDSISSMVSNDRSAIASADETPGSSPASSVVISSSGGMNGHPSTPGINGASRRSSMMSSATSRPSNAKRFSSLPVSSTGTNQPPRKASTLRSSTANASSIPRGMSPFPSPTSYSSATPTPGSRSQRVSMSLSDGKPRWNSSPHVNYIDFKPLCLTTPSTQRRTLSTHRSPLSASAHSAIPLPSPLGPDSSSSSAARSGSLTRPRISSRIPSSLAVRDRRGSSPSPAPLPPASIDVPRSRYSTQPSATKSLDSRRPSVVTSSTPARDDQEAIAEESPSSTPKPQRPTTAMASGRRSSMLPLPKVRAASGRDGALATTAQRRESAMGNGREESRGR
ncbi:hypothetical protein MMC08_006943 [Hypocenomyce scalaris]|nr:hypothetical protein [Hypocenomyce scalaris]